MASLRLFLAIAAAKDLELCELDVDIAFMYAPVKEDVYIRQPLGLSGARMAHPKCVISNVVSTDGNSHLASSTCFCVTGLSKTVGNSASRTRASTSSAPDTFSPWSSSTWTTFPLCAMMLLGSRCTKHDWRHIQNQGLG
jgi:hypothetical protein